MEGIKSKKKFESSNQNSKEIEVGYKHYLPNRKSILSKLKAKKRYSHKNFQKQKTLEDSSKTKTKIKTQKENISIKEAPSNPESTPKLTQDCIARFYTKERKKLNIWTFLFQKLYTSFNQILMMCEVERKLEFCRGIEETLENFLSETRKVAHSLKVEEQNKHNQSTAWEIRAPLKKEVSALNNLHKIDQKQVENRFDDKGQVEFKLLNELVSDGKMSFYEAIVLIIRERAVLFDLFNDELQSKEFLLNDGVEDLSLSRGSFAYQSVVLSRWLVNVM
jgi:hypothetical protein